jgi:hypothetical protein
LFPNESTTAGLPLAAPFGTVASTACAETPVGATAIRGPEAAVKRTLETAPRPSPLMTTLEPATALWRPAQVLAQVTSRGFGTEGAPIPPPPPLAAPVPAFAATAPNKSDAALIATAVAARCLRRAFGNGFKCPKPSFSGRRG